MPDAYRPVWSLDRQIAKVRAHLRTPRGRGDSAALDRLMRLQDERDRKDSPRLRDINEMLKVLYPADSALPLGAPLRALPHPLFAMLKKG